jgi:hypothetical protein
MDPKRGRHPTLKKQRQSNHRAADDENAEHGGPVRGIVLGKALAADAASIRNAKIAGE